MKTHIQFNALLQKEGVIAVIRHDAFEISTIQRIPTTIFAFIIKKKAQQVAVYDETLRILF